MKKTFDYFAVISSLLISINLAHANGEKCDENMHGQHHGEMDGMMFQKLDANGDGVISKAEFNAFNVRHFKKLDTNKDGKLTPEELQGGHKQEMGHGDGTTHLDQRFNAADANQDGGLDREEANNMPMLSQYFDEVDTNRDGKVTRQEYFDAMPLLHGANKIDKSGKSQSM